MCCYFSSPSKLPGADRTCAIIWRRYDADWMDCNVANLLHTTERVETDLNLELLLLVLLLLFFCEESTGVGGNRSSMAQTATMAAVAA